MSAAPDLEVGNIHPAFRAFWHPVAWDHEVRRGALFATTLLTEPLVLWRDDDGAPRAAIDACPHRGAPLSEGRLDGCELVCPFHGWRFSSSSGALVTVPSLGPDAPVPSRGALRVPASVCEARGIVWVALEPPRAPVLEWPDGDDPAYGGWNPTAHVAEVLAGYQTDNLLDASHFPFLHVSLSHRYPALGEYETVHLDDCTFATFTRKIDHDGVSTEGWLRYGFSAPFTVTLRSEEPDGRLRNSFFQAIQPIDERRTRIFFKVRVPQTDPDELAAMREVEEGVQLEDLAMNSALRRDGIQLPEGPRVEPCAAWWVQGDDWFVDIRQVVDGPEDNGLPYSQTRVFAGRFEIDSDGAACWHVVFDSGGPAPRTDRGAPGGLWLDGDDPTLMIEDAPGRFREWWRRAPAVGDGPWIDATDERVEVRIDGLYASAWCTDDGTVHAELRRGDQLLIQLRLGPAAR